MREWLFYFSRMGELYARKKARKKRITMTIRSNPIRKEVFFKKKKEKEKKAEKIPTHPIQIK